MFAHHKINDDSYGESVHLRTNDNTQVTMSDRHNTATSRVLASRHKKSIADNSLFRFIVVLLWIFVLFSLVIPSVRLDSHHSLRNLSYQNLNVPFQTHGEISNISDKATTSTAIRKNSKSEGYNNSLGKHLTNLAENEAKKRVEASNTSYESEEYNTNDVFEFAVRYVEERKNAYVLAGKSTSTWEMRGIGYAFVQHELVLVSILPKNSIAGEVNKIRIVNVNNKGNRRSNENYCKKWTIWVRVMGPEIFAGSATPVSTKDGCYWEFPFRLANPKTGAMDQYKVDSKLLMYNGQVSVDPGQCIIHGLENRNSPQYASSLTSLMQKTANEQHSGFIGFKLYAPSESCCEICTRIKNCTYWTSPPLSIMTEASQQGCELFYGNKFENAHREKLKVTPKQAIVFKSNQTSKIVKLKNSNVMLTKSNDSSFTPTGGKRRRRLSSIEFSMAHGPPHNGGTPYFVGCGWSFWFTHDFPCLDPAVDDTIPVFPVNHFDVRSKDSKESSGNKKVLEVCNVDVDENLRGSGEVGDLHQGRWIRSSFPNSTVCPEPMQIDWNYSSMFDIMQIDGNHPECWHRDDLSRVGQKCIEFCATESHKPWISELHKESEWYGVWENYNCKFLEFTDAQLQQCVNKRRIGSIEVTGKSVATYLRQYLNQRLANINFYEPNSINETVHNGNMLNVTLTTFGIPHLLWHKSETEWYDFLQSKSSVPEVLVGTNERYWVSGYYYSSEREPHVQVDRSEKISRFFKFHLDTKGYRMINAFDMTAAFTFDTATQMDGLHIIGPPAKMVIVKFLHYLCSEVFHSSEAMRDS